MITIISSDSSSLFEYVIVMELNLYSMYNVQYFIQTDIPLGRTTLESSL